MITREEAETLLQITKAKRFVKDSQDLPGFKDSIATLEQQGMSQLEIGVFIGVAWTEAGQP